MLSSGVHCRHAGRQARDLNRDAALSGRVIAEPTSTVTGRAPGSAAHDRTGEAAASGQLRHAGGQAVDLDGDHAVARRVVAELTVAVRAPTLRAAVREHCTRMIS